MYLGSVGDAVKIEDRNADTLMTVAEAAHRLRCRTETVRRWIAQGNLSASVLPGGTYRIREEDLAVLLRPVGPVEEEK